MADIQYLNYGDQQIEQQALMNNLANNVQKYVQTQPWSNKRKELFMSAYQDLMNRGVQGASNSTGQWTINVKGDLDLSTKSKKEQEMYQEAAYFIQQQMAGLPTKANQEEEKTKDLPVFDHSTFNKGFLTQMSNDYFGGNPALKTSVWNEFDKRNTETGLRDRTERAKKLISSLEKYAKTLKDSDYNFKDSPFGSLEELNNRIAKARTALIDTPTNTDDDFETLSALGINASDWFNNGSGDPYKTEGYEGTYGGYYNEHLPALEKKKAEEKAAKQKAIRDNQYTNLKFYGQGLNGKITNNISTQYLNQLAQQSNLNGDQQSELVGAFKLAAKAGQLEDLSKEELNKFGRFSTGYNKLGRLKKIDGVNGFYWDTYGKRIVRPYNVSNAPQTNFDEILKQNNPEAKKEQNELAKKLAQDKYLANTEMTRDKYLELAGIAADVASVIDPEPISAAGLSFAGTTARTLNRIFDEDGFTLSDAGHTLLDVGLSAFGAIPLVGDAALMARIASKLQKASGWLGVIFAASSVPQAAKASWNKLINNEDMTVDDWRAIGNVIMGFTQARKMILNNSAGKVIQRGETIDNNSPIRVQKTAQHFNKDSWNIRQRNQEQIKGPWYKKVWNYFKNPYSNITSSSSTNTPVTQHGNLPQPPKPKLDIKKPIPTLGPYYRKQGGIIDKQKIQKYKEFIKK